MSGSAIEWSPPSTTGICARRQDLADGRLDGGVRADRIGRQDRRVAEVEHAQHVAQRFDPGFEVRSGNDAGRPGSRAGPYRVPCRSDVRSSIGAPTIATVGAGEIRGVLRVGEAREGHQPGVVRLLAVGGPSG